MKEDIKCERCGKTLSATEKGYGAKRYCAACAIAVAEKEIEELRKKELEEKIRKEKKGNLKFIWTILQIFIITAAIVLIALNYKDFLRVFEPLKPIRVGTYVTDHKTDKCIANLWYISAMIQNDKIEDIDLKCPASKEKYIIEKSSNNIIVMCPTPEKHNAITLTVSKNKPIPEIESEKKK